MIYTAGDSHARWTFHDIAGIDIHKSLSTSLTMWRIGHIHDGLIEQIVADLGLTADDKLILSSGEIDCRCHVWLHVAAGESLEAIIERLVVPYVAKALTLPLHGAPLAIMGVVPPIPKGEVYYSGVILPVNGENIERVTYVRALNQRLADECAEYEIPFIEVYEAHADSAGLLRRDVSDGNVHVIKTAAMRAELQRLGWLA